MFRATTIALLLGAAANASAAPSYNEEVRPLLSANCFACHGPDEEERKAKTRLDVPGGADLVEVIARITSTDPDEVMPPPESNKTLKPGQIETLREWIAAGAKYEQHWAFVKPVDRTQESGFRRGHPVDAWVDQGLKKAGITAAPRADAHTLIRRLYLDLVGLPPTPEEADAFAADPSDAAYAQIVDKLLASPRYGERWARRWLDLARYADTNGYEKDRNRSIWPYRDWVIRALNADMPFDQFTVEQIAGDMLPDAKPEQLVATGFHRNTMLNEEGGIDPLEFRFHAMTDRINTTGTTWLGLTIGCAQCHTHKYDPVTHHDYYGMMAYLNNADEPDFLIPAEGAEDKHQADLAQAERLLDELPDKWPLPTSASSFVAAPVKAVTTEGESKAQIQKDQSVLISGPRPETDIYTAVIETGETGISSLRLETLTFAEGKGPGRTDHGNFVLSEIELVAEPLKGSQKPRRVSIKSSSAEVAQENFAVAGAHDGDPKSGWAIHDPKQPLNQNRAATFTFAQPIGFAGGTRLEVKLTQIFGGNHTIGRFRFKLGIPAEEAADEQPKPRALAQQAFEAWADAEREKVVDWQPLVPTALSANVPYLVHEGDGVVFVGGDTSKHDIFNITLAASEKPITALQLEALPDDRLPDRGPGTTFYEGRKGDFYLTEFKVAGAVIKDATETYAKNRFGSNPVSAKLATDGDVQTGWSVAGEIGKRHVAVFVFDKPLPPGRAIDLEMHFGRHYASSLGKFRLSATASPGGAIASKRDPETDLLLATPPADLDGDRKAALWRAFLMQAPELAAHSQRISDLRKPPGGDLTLVMKERPAKHPRATHLHNRGEYTQPKEQVPPRLPEALLPEGVTFPKDRLGFARWLAAPDNPLTARVVANRHWAAFFGTGIVPTLDDFGMQGRLPSHPELLDHLAVFLVENGWSIKALHRHIVTSAVYQRASGIRGQESGAGLLARFPRQRLEAEIIRDSALASAGLLSDKMFGAPVRPPQPAGVTESAYGRPKWNPSGGADRYRRSIYTFIKRTAPFAMFTTFDAGSGEACIARRDRSNTPLQALTLMNDPMFVEIADKSGERLKAAPGDIDAKITSAFRRLLTRPPTASELRKLREFHAKHGNWAALARVLLSLDETVNKP